MEPDLFAGSYELIDGGPGELRVASYGLGCFDQERVRLSPRRD